MCVLLVGGLGGGGDAVCLPGRMFVHHVVRGLFAGGSVTVRRMRAFAVANEMGRGGVSVVVAAAFANSSVASLPGMPLRLGTQIRVVGPSLLSSRWRIDWVSCAPL